MSQHISKLLAALGAAIVAAVGSPIPDNLKKMVMLVLVLVIVDTFSGVYTAIYTRTLESHRLVEKLAHKGVLYGILMLIAFVPCALFVNWSCAYAMAFLMMTRETLSLIENAKKLMMNGKDFGLFRAFLERIGSFLAVGAEQAVAVLKVESPGQSTPVATVIVTPPVTPVNSGKGEKERV